jgi:hypothetical protein
MGKISEGIECTIETVDKLIPIKIPPPIRVCMSFALAETTDPANAMSGVNVASHLRSRTSESLQTTGESALCMRSGP